MEASWLLSKKEVWERPFRLALGRTVGTVPVPGDPNRRDLVIEAGAFSQQMALPWQADFRDCTAGPVDDPSVAGKTRRVGWWPTNRPDEVFSAATPTVRKPWARDASENPFPDNDAAGFKAMVDNWWTLGFIIETTPTGAPKDLYEVEFNVAPQRPAGCCSGQRRTRQRGVVRCCTILPLARAPPAACFLRRAGYLSPACRAVAFRSRASAKQRRQVRAALTRIGLDHLTRPLRPRRARTRIGLGRRPAAVTQPRRLALWRCVAS